jgi:hypothetical protein
MTTWLPRSATLWASALCGLLLGVPDISSAESLSKLALGEQPIPLLGGRLSVRMPAAAKAQARGHSIMEAPASNEDETRVMVDAENERLVLMAYELYALSGGNLEKAVRAEAANSLGKDAATINLEKLPVAPPLTAVVVVPERQDGTREANLVLGLYVGSGDGTVQYLAFYANPAGARDAAGVAALCRKIAATVSAGSQRLSSQAGARSFPGFINDRLVATVPEGFVASVQEGPDFSVYRLRKLVRLGEQPSVCGIYLGGHPAYIHRQTEAPPDKVTPLKGRLLGREVKWQNWSTAKGAMSEVIVRYPKGKGMRMHVFCTAGSLDDVKALQAVAETLSVQEPKK